MIQEDNPLIAHHFVLIDEDNFTARAFRTLLPTLGDVSFDILPTLEEARTALARVVESAATTRPILLVDLDGEEYHGLSLLKSIRTGEAGLPRGLPVLAVAGFGDQSWVNVAQALDVGAVLARPLTRHALHAACRRLSMGGVDPRPVEFYMAVELPSGS